MSNQIFHFSNTGISSGQRFYLKDDVSGIFVRNLKIDSNFPVVASNLVYNTGNQTISGVKTFASRPTVNGTGFLLSGEAGALPSTIVYTTGNQNISGVKTFLNNVQVLGTGIFNALDLNNIDTISLSGVDVQITNGNVSLTNTPTVNGNLVLTGVDLTPYATISNLLATGITLDNKINSLSGVSVLTFGNQGIYGNKTFYDNISINNLTVTGTQTIANISNTNVASNYILLNITGGAVDGGTFFVTGDGLTGINDNGAIIGYSKNTNKFKFGTGSRSAGLSLFKTIAAQEDLDTLSGVSVLTFGNQSINGNKSFYGDILANNLVYNTGNQTISGRKIFERIDIKAADGQIVGYISGESNESSYQRLIINGFGGPDEQNVIIQSAGNSIQLGEANFTITNNNGVLNFNAPNNEDIYINNTRNLVGSNITAYFKNISAQTGTFEKIYADNLVYNTGNQTISGIKTFSSPIYFSSGQNDGIYLGGSGGYIDLRGGNAIEAQAGAGGIINLAGSANGKGGSIDGKNNGGSIKFFGTSKFATGGLIDISAGPSSPTIGAMSNLGVGGNGGSLQLIGGQGGEELNAANGGKAGSIIGNGGIYRFIGGTPGDWIIGQGYDGGIINFSAGLLGSGGSIDISNGGGSINFSQNSGAGLSIQTGNLPIQNNGSIYNKINDALYIRKNTVWEKVITNADNLVYTTGNQIISGVKTFANSGVFSLSGAVPLGLPNNPLSVVGSGNTYLQLNIQNRSTGTTATADLVITANNGTDSANFINLGINNSGYNDPNFSNGRAYDGYLFINGGSLDIGTQTANTNIEFHVAGTTADKVVARINSSGLNILSGTVNASNLVYNTGYQEIDGNKYFIGSPFQISNGLYLQVTSGGISTQSNAAYYADNDVNFDFGMPFLNTRISIGENTGILGLSINSENGQREVKIYETGGYITSYKYGPYLRMGRYGTLISEGSENKVGIGTLFPTEKVHIGGGNLRVDGNISANNLVYNTGNQTISGVKNFASRPTVNGTGVLLIGEGGGGGGGSFVSPPANPNSAGTQYSLATDSNYLYVCVATNSWKRTALAVW
jgi:hypothetical protein